MGRQTRILLGPPGTGKTETLVRELQKVLKAGTSPERIAFVSFSRRAVEEAKRRAKEVSDAQFPYFRTIHSLAYKVLGLSRGDVLSKEQLLDFGEQIGLPIDA